MTMVFDLESGELVLKSNDSSDNPYPVSAAMIDPEMAPAYEQRNTAIPHRQKHPELQLQLQEVKFSS